MITIDEFQLFCERSIDGMAAAINRLDDTTVNTAPGLDGANAPYAIVTHALGALRWWTTHVVCGYTVDRDRAGEFASTGTVADLLERCDSAKHGLRALTVDLEAAETLAYEPTRTTIPLEGEWTVGAALLHSYEELTQHLGHLEITVDLVAGQK